MVWGGCLEGVGRLSTGAGWLLKGYGGCLEDVRRYSEGCLEVV